MTPEEKIEALMDYFGLEREEAIAQLIDMGEIEEAEIDYEWPKEVTA